MFDSLDDQMKQDEAAVSTREERWLRKLIVIVISLFLFAGLYAVIRFWE